MKKQRILKIWKDKWKILEGIWNFICGTKRKKEIAEARIDLCRLNKCGLYDKYGQSPNAYVKGAETCAGCGCSLALKTMSMMESCTLQELGQIPMWVSEKE